MRDDSETPAWLRAAPGIFLLLWSGGFTFAKLGLAYAPPLTFLAIRYALVLVVLLPFLLVLRPPLPARAMDWLHLAVVGFLIQAVYFGLSYLSFASGVPAGTLALIVSLQPVLVGLLSPALTGERVGARRWAGLTLGLAGTGVVIVSRGAVATASGAGVLAAFGALAGMTAGTLYEKRFGAPHHPVTANLVQFAVGLAVIAPTALWREDVTQLQWSGELAAALAYLVVGNSLVSMTLLLAMIRRGEVARVSALFFLVPPTAALLAWAMLGERMPALGWAGMAVAAAGVAIATRPGRGGHGPPRTTRTRATAAADSRPTRKA